MRIKFWHQLYQPWFQKGHPLKKTYQLQKQKIKTMWSCMILFHAQKTLVPTQDDHHHRFSELKLMNKSRG